MVYNTNSITTCFFVVYNTNNVIREDKTHAKELSKPATNTFGNGMSTTNIQAL